MITLALTSAFALCFGWWVCTRPYKFPPGPRGWPFIGCLLSVSKWHPVGSFLGLLKLYQQFGPVVGFYIGPQAVVSICGYEACKEAFMTDSLNGRPDNGPARMKSKGKRMGVMLVDGHFLIIQKRFTLSRMREFGFGRKNMQSLLNNEVQVLLGQMKRHLHKNGNIFEFKNYFNISLINTLWWILASDRFERDDRRLLILVELFDLVGRSGDIVQVAFPCPITLMKLFSAVFPKLGRMDLLKEVWKFIEETIEDHKRHRPSEARDFIDIYLQEIEKNQDDSFSEEQLANIILDVFSAGADTTGNAIGFLLLYLIHYPNVQTKMQMELDEVCGASLPLLENKPRLIYTQAVLMEVQRMSNVAPLAIPRRALKSTPFRGYVIPKDAYVILNTHSIHMDENYWVDPEVFRPERHIDSNNCIIQTDRLLPFGAGKRSCLGESLARASYFLFSASLVKTFTFRSSSDDSPFPSLVPLNGFTLAHRPFRAFLAQR